MNVTQSQTITKSELYGLKLKAKPRCPFCDNPLSYIYEGAYGIIGVKCLRCKHELLIDTDTMTVHPIEEAN